jgi:hypothetical protein
MWNFRENPNAIEVTHFPERQWSRDSNWPIQYM